MSACGHIFHVKCLRKRFEIKWLTPRIFFNFCYCPLCKKWITVDPDSELHKFSEEFRLLHEKIENMAYDRLKFEEL
jgi:E3 ubiquitin-protein ligase MYCBP2